MVALRSRVAEVGLREIRRAGPAHHGTPGRRPETQPAPHADRRRRPAREVVLPTESRAPRSQTYRKSDEKPACRPRNAEVAKLRRLADVSEAGASSRNHERSARGIRI